MTADKNATDNIFSGLKVVDLASFIAGPSAAVILSDFGAEVIKVEPPSGDLWRIGHKIPPQPQAKDAYPWHLANRNKRGMTLDAGEPPTWPVAGSGDNATAVGLYSAIVTALYRREHTGKGSHVTTSLLAEGIWAASMYLQAALAGAKFFPLHDRKN